MDLKDDLKFKKEKYKTVGKLLEYEIRIAHVAAQIFWNGELGKLKGVSET